MRPSLVLLCAIALLAEDVKLRGLQKPVEVLRDHWGVPHIYAQTQDDLFFAQGYMAARDRLFQLDLWRRQGTGKLAEALGPAFVERDRTAILLRYRGDWREEWPSYAPDARNIVNSFVRGVNAYIQDPRRKPSAEFRKRRRLMEVATSQESLSCFLDSLSVCFHVVHSPPHARGQNTSC